jgi:hypothetical protein
MIVNPDIATGGGNKPETDYAACKFATEISLSALIHSAKLSGLDADITVGINQLPELLKRKFELACELVLLEVTPKETHDQSVADVGFDRFVGDPTTARTEID